MKRFSPLIILLTAFLVVSCDSYAKDNASLTNEASLGQTAETYETEHGYWGNPNANYIATA